MSKRRGIKDVNNSNDNNISRALTASNDIHLPNVRDANSDNLGDVIMESQIAIDLLNSNDHSFGKTISGNNLPVIDTRLVDVNNNDNESSKALSTGHGNNSFRDITQHVTNGQQNSAHCIEDLDSLYSQFGHWRCQCGFMKNKSCYKYCVKCGKAGPWKCRCCHKWYWNATIECPHCKPKHTGIQILDPRDLLNQSLKTKANLNDNILRHVTGINNNNAASPPVPASNIDPSRDVNNVDANEASSQAVSIGNNKSTTNDIFNNNNNNNNNNNKSSSTLSSILPSLNTSYRKKRKRNIEQEIASTESQSRRKRKNYGKSNHNNRKKQSLNNNGKIKIQVAVVTPALIDGINTKLACDYAANHGCTFKDNCGSGEYMKD